MTAISEVLAHDRGLSLCHLTLNGSRNPLALFKRQAERFGSRIRVPLNAGDLDLPCRPAVSLGHKLHPPNQLFQGPVSMPKDGA